MVINSNNWNREKEILQKAAKYFGVKDNIVDGGSDYPVLHVPHQLFRMFVFNNKVWIGYTTAAKAEQLSTLIDKYYTILEEYNENR